MAHKDLLLKPPTPRERAHRRRAIAASLGVHSAVLAFVLLLALFCHQEIKRHNGSPPGEPTITLSTMVIVSPPPLPTPPVPDQPTPTPPTPPTPETSPVAATPPPAPAIAPPPPEEALPVLPPTLPAVQPTQTVAQKKTVAHPPPPSHRVASASTTHTSSDAPTRESTPSTYKPGPSDLPFPPYPPEAQSAGKTGTVIVNVQFNQQGRVTSTEVTQSSGVAILDRSTQSFIHAHWHCPAYAGQTVSVPVQYHLENL